MNSALITKGGDGAVGSSPSPLEACQFITIARMIGPAGVRTIESALLGVVKGHLIAVKELLGKHINVLESLPTECVDGDAFRLAIKDFHAGESPDLS